MESNDELKEIVITNRTCYYFDDIIRIGNFDFSNILLRKKSNENLYENILIYDISYRAFMGAKLLGISSDKVDGFIKIYDRTRYLVLFNT